MAGLTDSANILLALNQAVKAINDLVLGGGGDTTVNVEAPNVTVTPQITVNCSCGCGGGSTPPQTPGEEGGTPPPGTGEPSGIDERKCKVANILIQELISYTNNMDSLGLFSWSLDYLTLGGILNSIANGFSSGLLKLTFQVGGWLTNLQNLIFSGGLGSQIPETLSSNQDAMVCALYNSDNTTDAKNSVVAASGLSSIDSSYLELVLTTEALNMLFFSLPGSENIISAYEGGADCRCGSTCDDALLGDYTLQAEQFFTGPDRWGLRITTDTNDPQSISKDSLGCYFGLKDNHLTVSGFSYYGTYWNVETTTYGGVVSDFFTNDLNSVVFDKMYSLVQIYQSLTPFSVSFEIDRTTR